MRGKRCPPSWRFLNLVVCHRFVSPTATHFLELPKKGAKKISPASHLILQCWSCAGRVTVARMFRYRYAECAPEMRLRPHNTPRFGAGTRGEYFNLLQMETGPKWPRFFTTTYRELGSTTLCGRKPQRRVAVSAHASTDSDNIPSAYQAVRFSRSYRLQRQRRETMRSLRVETKSTNINMFTVR